MIRSSNLSFGDALIVYALISVLMGLVKPFGVDKDLLNPNGD